LKAAGSSAYAFPPDKPLNILQKGSDPGVNQEVIGCLR
jgi:hypothetical protein